MSEDKKDIKQEEKEEKKVGKKPADVKAEKKNKEIEPVEGREETELPEKIDGLEELPDDVKKKLEKRKSEKKPLQKGKKKKKKAPAMVSVGKVYVKATYNNTIVTIADAKGNVISWASAGIAGFKGPKKSTPYAAQIITRIAVGKAKEVGLKDVSVFVKGVGTGRESAVRALNANGLNVTYIKDVTPVPHNGCRKRKPRRV